MVRDHHMWGGRQEPPPADDAPAWILGALPDDWFTQRPDISIDRDEIVIVGRLPEPTLAAEPADSLGWSADAMEAQAFAYLAVRSRAGLPLTFPTTTGVPHPMTGGRLAEAA